MQTQSRQYMWGLSCGILYLFYMMCLALDVHPSLPIAIASTGIVFFMAFIYFVRNARAQYKNEIWLSVFGIYLNVILICSCARVPQVVIHLLSLVGSVLATVSWCFVSHVHIVNSKSLHWYGATTLLVVLLNVCHDGFFNWNPEAFYFFMICGITSIHLVYLIYICREITSKKQCLYVNMTLHVFVLLVSIHVLRLLHHLGDIESLDWPFVGVIGYANLALLMTWAIRCRSEKPYRALPMDESQTLT